MAIGPQQLPAVRAMYRQAQIHSFHGAGHAPIFAREAEYIDVVRHFLATVSG